MKSPSRSRCRELIQASSDQRIVLWTRTRSQQVTAFVLGWVGPCACRKDCGEEGCARNSCHQRGLHKLSQQNALFCCTCSVKRCPRMFAVSYVLNSWLQVPVEVIKTVDNVRVKEVRIYAQYLHPFHYRIHGLNKLLNAGSCKPGRIFRRPMFAQ